MPAKKPSKHGEKPQRDRFEDAAKNAGGIDSDAFERAVGKIVPPAKSIKPKK